MTAVNALMDLTVGWRLFRVNACENIVRDKDQKNLPVLCLEKGQRSAKGAVESK